MACCNRRAKARPPDQVAVECVVWDARRGAKIAERGTRPGVISLISVINPQYCGMFSGRARSLTSALRPDTYGLVAEGRRDGGATP